MKKKQKKGPVKAMFSLKRRFDGKGASGDPIISTWRVINRNPAVSSMPLGARVMALAAALPPYEGRVVSEGEDLPPEFIDRVNDLRAYLEDAGELDPREIARERDEMDRMDRAN